MSTEDPPERLATGRALPNRGMSANPVSRSGGAERGQMGPEEYRE